MSTTLGDKREAMTTYSKATEESPDVRELLELSTLYHKLIGDLAELWEVDLTPDLRHKAFLLVSATGDEVKIKTLATVVLKEVGPRDSK